MIHEPVPVVLNPVAGGGRLLRQRLSLERAAEQCGIRLEWWPTDRPGHGESLGRRAADEGRPLVLAYGGDGTYNEVARGLLGSETALGVVPGGTTSVLAWELGIPRPAARSLPALVGGVDRTMRVGRTDRGEIILMMLSAGPDTQVLERLLPDLKRVGGRVGIGVQAVLETARARPLPELVVTVDGEPPTPCGWAIVGKSRCYGGPYHATPGADPFASGFELVFQRTVGRRAAVPFALGIPTGRHLRRRDVVCRSARDVELAAVNGACARYQVDGDLRGELPVRVDTDDRPLVVRLPHRP